jgi:hypothetical protein
LHDVEKETRVTLLKIDPVLIHLLEDLDEIGLRRFVTSGGIESLTVDLLGEGKGSVLYNERKGLTRDEKGS